MCLLKFNNKNRTLCDVCPNLTIKIREQRQWRRCGFFIVNFEHFLPCYPDDDGLIDDC